MVNFQLATNIKESKFLFHQISLKIIIFIVLVIVLNWAGGKKFYVCIVCKKEKLVKTLDVENEEKFINEWKRTLSKYN